jgi:hypothetical protein|nr:MAG TPA: hypothetical protein [Microviridae sp.]
MQVVKTKIIHDLTEFRFVFSRDGEVFIFIDSQLDFYSTMLCTYMRIERRRNKYVVVNDIWELGIDLFVGSKSDCISFIISYFEVFIKNNHLHLVTHE